MKGTVPIVLGTCPERSIGLFQKKIQIEGVKYSMWKFQGSIKKEVEFPGVFKKKLSGIFMGLGF